MSSRARPAVLAGLLVLLLGAVITFQGYGPLAAGDDEPAADAPITTPAAGDTASASGTTTDGATSPPAAAAIPDGAESPTSASGDLDEAVTEPNRQAFERSLVALLSLQHQTTGASPTALATSTAQACAALDRDAALPAALNATCEPTIKVAKLTAVLGKRCTSASPACARTATRLSAAADDYITTRRALAKVLRAEVPAGACRKALLPTGEELQGTAAVSRALGQLARAANGRGDFPQSAQDVIDAGERASTDQRPAATVVESTRAACHLARYPDIG